MVELGLNKNKLDVARNGWRILQRNMTNVQNLVLNMLAFSKVRKPVLELTQLNQAVHDAIEMLTAQADFLVDSVQRADGSFPVQFEVASGVGIEETRTLAAQAFAVRGLLEAYKVTRDQRYLDAATRPYDVMNPERWADNLVLYHAELDSDE